MELVRVKGLSMAPHLRDDDLLWVESSTVERLSAGQLVLVERPDLGDYVVHRVVPGGLIKGDRVRVADSSLPGGLKILGSVQGRFVENGTAHGVVSYQGEALRLVYRLQSLLSVVNRGEGRILPRLAVLALVVLGKGARWIEDRFYTRPR